MTENNILGEKMTTEKFEGDLLYSILNICDKKDSSENDDAEAFHLMKTKLTRMRQNFETELNKTVAEISVTEENLKESQKAKEACNAELVELGKKVKQAQVEESVMKDKLKNENDRKREKEENLACLRDKISSVEKLTAVHEKMVELAEAKEEIEKQKNIIDSLNVLFDDCQKMIWRLEGDLDKVGQEYFEMCIDMQSSSPPHIGQIDVGGSEKESQEPTTSSSAINPEEDYPECPECSLRIHHDNFVEHLRLCLFPEKGSGEEDPQSSAPKRSHSDRMATCENVGTLECPPTKRSLREEGEGEGEGAHFHDTTVEAVNENSASTSKYNLRRRKTLKLDKKLSPV